MTLGSDGFLYGTTYGGGDSLAGTIFKIARVGSEPILLHTFAPGKIVPPLPYGQQPTRQQAMDAAGGNLYGTTYAGGPTIRGVVFRLSLDGQYTILHYFGGNASNPVAGFVEVTEDNASLLVRHRLKPKRTTSTVPVTCAAALSLAKILGPCFPFVRTVPIFQKCCR